MRPSFDLRSALILTFLVSIPAIAAAQVIDVFEDQDAMPQTKVSVTDSDGNVVIDNGTASSDSGGIQADGGITLEFERQNSSILVPASVNGKKVYFLFDTGATFTTLIGPFARAANVYPRKNYPVGMSQTAGGKRAMQFGLIDRLDLGGRRHSAVTYAVCNECPSGIYKGRPIVGLLGLNVVGRYRYSIDEGAGKIEMYPHSEYSNRKRDVTPWLKADFDSVPETFKEWRAVVTMQSQAPRSIRDLRVQFTCANGKSHTLGPKTISARNKAKFSKSFEAGECPGMNFDIVSAKW